VCLLGEYTLVHHLPVVVPSSLLAMSFGEDVTELGLATLRVSSGGLFRAFSSLLTFLDPDHTSLVPAGARGRRCDSTGDAIVDAVLCRRRIGRQAGISVRFSKLVRVWLPPHLEARTRMLPGGGGMDICSPIARRSWEPGCGEIPLYLFRDLVLWGNASTDSFVDRNVLPTTVFLACCA
jgi:hypothetical protein